MKLGEKTGGEDSSNESDLAISLFIEAFERASREDLQGCPLWVVYRASFWDRPLQREVEEKPEVTRKKYAKQPARSVLASGEDEDAAELPGLAYVGWLEPRFIRDKRTGRNLALVEISWPGIRPSLREDTTVSSEDLAAIVGWEVILSTCNSLRKLTQHRDTGDEHNE